MSTELERTTTERRTVDRSGSGYPQPPAWTLSGQFDRRLEADHRERMRQLYRDAEYAVGLQDKELLETFKAFDCIKQAMMQAKLDLNHARRLSRVLDEDDPELKAQFAVLDAEAFQQYRLRLLGG